MALSALRAHCYNPRSKIMPSMGRVGPNSMAELVDCMQHAVFLEALPPAAPTALAPGKCAGEVEAALKDAAFNMRMAGRQRLKARLHLEVLRFVHCCLFMFGADPIHA